MVRWPEMAMGLVLLIGWRTAGISGCAGQWPCAFTGRSPDRLIYPPLFCASPNQDLVIPQTVNHACCMPPLVRRFFYGHLMLWAIATICRMAASLANQACLHLATFGRILAPQFVWHGGAVFQPPRYRPCNTAPAARDDCAVLADGIDAVCPVGDMNGGHGRQLLHKNRLPIRLITISAVSVLNTLNKETK